MTVLEITLKPLEPYFFGDRHSPDYGGKKQRIPYYLTSANQPAQSALFGILRYLGIRNPSLDFELGENAAYMGRESFHLLRPSSDFGKIIGISPLMLTDDNGFHYLPAPRNHRAVTDWTGAQTGAEFQPYRHFRTTETLDGPRWTLRAEEFSAKQRDEAQFLCLETGRMVGNLFSKQVRVGINRSQMRKRADKTQISGFFKKEYVMLDPAYAFRWYAELEDDAFGQNAGFRRTGVRAIYSGLGKTAFTAKWKVVDRQPDLSPLRACFPQTVAVDGAELDTACYAYAMSDLFFDGDVRQLRQHCMLALADCRDYRVFTTDYSAKSMRERYRKSEQYLKLLRAGSVFFFRDARQQAEFRALLEAGALFSHGQTAGFNKLHYSEMEDEK